MRLIAEFLCSTEAVLASLGNYLYFLDNNIDGGSRVLGSDDGGVNRIANDFLLQLGRATGIANLRLHQDLG